MSKRLSKYAFFFDYFDKLLIVLSVTTGSISIASFATVIGAPVGMASASFILAFSISTGAVKKTVNETFIKFLLARDKFMPEMHLKQPAALGKLGFTYSA